MSTWFGWIFENSNLICHCISIKPTKMINFAMRKIARKTKISVKIELRFGKRNKNIAQNDEISSALNQRNNTSPMQWLLTNEVNLVHCFSYTLTNTHTHKRIPRSHKNHFTIRCMNMRVCTEAQLVDVRWNASKYELLRFHSSKLPSTGTIKFGHAFVYTHFTLIHFIACKM